MQKKLKAHDHSQEANKYFSKKSQKVLTGMWIILLKQKRLAFKKYFAISVIWFI
jgi:hypothetical protein